MTLDIPARHFDKVEFFNNKTQEFITVLEERSCEPTRLLLEHSLLSIKKWESKWHKPFISGEPLKPEEFIDYVRCMTTNSVKDQRVYDCLMDEDVTVIQEYMNDQKSAWTLTEKPDGKKQKTKYTVEAVYYAMIQYGIPLECEKWHFNSLLALIDYFGFKGGSVPGAGGQKKKSEREILEMYRAMNEKARAKYHSKG